MLLFLSSLALVTFAGCSDEAETDNETTVEDDSTEQVETNNENTASAENNESNDKLKQEEQTEFIHEAFRTLLDYDNTTYADRSQKATEYFTGDTLQVLTGTEHLDTEVAFTSTSDNYEVYQGVGNNENQFVLILDTEFQVEDNDPTQLTNIYMFELLEQDNEYQIGEMEITPKQQQTMIP